MADPIRQERDRFVAFAFAAADLLLELDLDQTVLSAHGAVQSFTGLAPERLIGNSFNLLFTEGDRLVASRILDLLPESGRLEPAKLRIDHLSGHKLETLMGACRMPTIPGHIFVSLSLSGIPEEVGVERDEATGLFSGSALIAMACDATQSGKDTPSNLTLMRVDGLAELEKRLPEDRAHELLAEIGATLRARSLRGEAAARLSGDSFGFIDNGRNASAAIAEDIGLLAESLGFDDALRPSVAQIELSGGTLDRKDVDKALSYAMKQFLEDSDRAFFCNSIKQDLSQIIDGALERTSALRRHIDQRSLSFVYQPVVTLAARAVHHYEALVRSPDGRSAFDTITFGENVGLICDLDHMICSQVLVRLEEQDSPAVAINLSGASVQSERFRDDLARLLKRSSVQANKVIFELTESSMVERLDEVANFIRWLRIKGYRVCIDDFGAGAATYSYLRKFEVDFVKIDGPFLQAAGKKFREKALIKSIATLCRELGCLTIGEMIETVEQAELAQALGIGFGQGWLFGRPLPELPRLPLRARQSHKAAS